MKLRRIVFPRQVILLAFALTDASLHAKDIFVLPPLVNGRLELRDVVIEDKIISFPGMIFEAAIWERVVLLNCEVRELTFGSESRISDTSIHGCAIGDLEFFKARIDSISFANCRASSVRLRSCNVGRLTLRGGSVEAFGFYDSDAGHMELFGASPAKIEMENGSIRVLHIAKLIGNDVSVTANGTVLDVINVSARSLERFEIGQARFAESQPKLWQEVFARQFSPGSAARVEGLTASLEVYRALAEKFRSSGNRAAARLAEYRFHVVERDLLPGWWNRAFDWILHDCFRAGYGLIPMRAVQTAIMVWLGFAFIFGFLGMLRIGWGVAQPTDLAGKELDGERFEFVVRPQYGSWFSYVATCLVFSFDQLCLFGSNALQLANITEHARFLPRRFAPVGIGRPLSAAESTMGLFLFVMLSAAFLQNI